MSNVFYLNLQLLFSYLPTFIHQNPLRYLLLVLIVISKHKICSHEVPPLFSCCPLYFYSHYKLLFMYLVLSAISLYKFINFVFNFHGVSPLTVYNNYNLFLFSAQAKIAPPPINISPDSNCPIVNPHDVRKPICASGARNCSQIIRNIAYSIPIIPANAPGNLRSFVNLYRQYIMINSNAPSVAASYNGLGWRGIVVSPLNITPQGASVGRPITSRFIKFAMRPKNNPIGPTIDIMSSTDHGFSLRRLANKNVATITPISPP